MRKEPDVTGRTFAVGDIHGSAGKLRALMARLPWDPAEDTLVFLGDYINRGPDSRGVIDTLLALSQTAPKAVFLIGNHEHCLLEYARTHEPRLLHQLRSMGVEATLSSYGEQSIRTLRDLSFLPEAHRQFLTTLRPFYREGTNLFVHAGLPAGEEPESCPVESLTETREPFLPRPDHHEDRLLVFGHTPFESPFVRPGLIGIDTGAIFGNLLTALELPALRFHHA